MNGARVSSVSSVPPVPRPVRSIVVGTAGHIDHGKSSLVLALTGTDPDRLKEEKARGITIDLGFAHMAHAGVNFAFVDVPGHERFVRNMLAGAGGIDVVLLVIAADESVMPQTREHFAICRLLEVPAGAIVLTKVDAADAETRELAALEARELVAGSFLHDAPLVRVSSRTGEGLDELKHVLAALAGRAAPRMAGTGARLPVDRVFSVKGFGTVATGTLVTGTLREGQTLAVLPDGLTATARSVQVHGQGQQLATAGERVAVNLGGLDVADLERGATLCEPGTLEPTTRCDVVLELLPEARPLRHGARVRFHQGTSEIMGRVSLASHRGETQPVADLRPGAAAYTRVRLERPAVLTRGDRFIVRAYSPAVTIGGGSVLDPHPPRGAIRTAAAFARFSALDAAVTPEAAALVFIEERGLAGLSRSALINRAGAAAGDVERIVRRLLETNRVQVVGDLVVSRREMDAAAARLGVELRTHHAAQPLSEGLHREEARAKVAPRASAAVFDAIVSGLVAGGQVSGRDRLSIAGRSVSLTPQEERIREALIHVYREGGLTPPDAAAARAAAGGDAATVDRMAALLVRQRVLTRVDTLMFHTERLEALKADVRALKEPGGTATLDVASFKQRYGVSRKFAIPLLEYLDRERVTRRVGESRVLV